MAVLSIKYQLFYSSQVGFLKIKPEKFFHAPFKREAITMHSPVNRFNSFTSYS